MKPTVNVQVREIAAQSGVRRVVSISVPFRRGPAGPPGPKGDQGGIGNLTSVRITGGSF